MPISFPRLLAWLLVLLPLAAQAGPSTAAAEFDPEKAVSVDAVVRPAVVVPGTEATLSVTFHVPAGYHITDPKYGMFFVAADTTDRLLLTDVKYPKGITEHEELVYRGDVTLVGRFTPKPGEGDTLAWKLQAGYQICSETGDLTCYMPVEKELEVQVVLGDASAAAAAAPVVADEEVASDSLAAAPATGLEGRLQDALQRGSWMAFLLVFLGGILSSLTPCVYPVIPITISFIGARSKGRLHGFMQSLFFVAGMALVYSVLGLVAAVTGGSFGSLGQSPVVQTVIAVIFLVFAASMFGAFELQLPSSLSAKLQEGDKSGPLGAVLMGAITGFIAAPCVGPIIVTLLVFIAATQNLALGFFLMLSYALGMGVLFLLIGTFAGALNSLPGAGGWMETVKKFFGVVMVAMAVYFLRDQIPAGWMPWLIGAGLVVFAVFTGAFDPVDEDSETSRKLFKAVGWIALLLGARFLLFGAGSGPQAGGEVAALANPVEVEWTVSSPDADSHAELLAAATADGKPVMVDFWATWCAQCKELDHKTWTDPAVKAEAERFTRIKMDMTQSESEWAKTQNSAFGVVGMPTVIFYDGAGKEVERFVGFQEPEKVLEIMKGVK